MMVSEYWLLYLIGALYALWLILAAIERIRRIPLDAAEKKRIEQLARDTETREARLTQERERFAELKAEATKSLEQERRRFAELQTEAAIAVETMCREKALGFPWLATAYSEYQKLCDLKLADQLLTPA